MDVCSKLINLKSTVVHFLTTYINHYRHLIAKAGNEGEETSNMLFTVQSQAREVTRLGPSFVCLW